MRMRGKKPIFSYRDTYDMGHTLSPIICEGLKKFKATVEKSNVAGVPGLLIQDLGFELGGDYDFEYVRSVWMDYLDKMIYAFDYNEEPTLEDFNVTYTWEDNCGIRCSNPEGMKLYKEAEGEWIKRVEEGRALFAKYFGSLWW